VTRVMQPKPDLTTSDHNPFVSGEFTVQAQDPMPSGYVPRCEDDPDDFECEEELPLVAEWSAPLVAGWSTPNHLPGVAEWKIPPSEDQQSAFDSVMQWFQDPESKTMTLGGYAGTGKTTIIGAILSALTRKRTAVCAFTGKAVSVLKRKGIDAQTLHSLMYVPVTTCVHCDAEVTKNAYCWRCGFEDQKTKWSRVLLLDLDLVIVDEASMLDVRLVKDLEALAAKILYVGDHGQLEPIGDDPGIMRSPEIRLERIHRQSEGSSIIHFAHEMRMGTHPATWEPTDDVTVHIVRSLNGVRMADYDAILCGYNKTRVAVNRRVRKELGYAGMPSNGERLICLQNDNDLGVFNGMVVHLTSVRRGAMDDVIVVNFEDDLGQRWTKVPVSLEQFDNPVRNDGRSRGIGIFDFGWAMTVHKCVSGDTLIQTSNGWQRIDALAGKLGHVATMDGTLQEYSDFIERPESEMLTLKCEGGYQICVTPDHRMRVYDEKDSRWITQESGSIKPGMWLRLRLGEVAGTHPEPAILPPTPQGDVRARPISTPAQIDVEMAEFLGLMVGDGTLFRRGVRLAKRHSDVVDRFTFLGERLFGLTPRLCLHMGINAAEFHSTILSDWLRQVGGMDPCEKSIPAPIYSGPTVIRASFLRGLFEDATVNVKGDYVDHIEFTNVSHELVRTVQTFLLEFGIVSTINTDHRQAKLYIYSDSIGLFRDSIGFVAKTKNDRLHGRCSRPTRRRIPFDYKLLRGASRNNARSRGYISRAVAEDLGLTAELEFHYVRVESIEVGRSKSYCLTVPSTGSFLQNRFDGLNSQGSEWEKVAVIEQISESWNPARWRYTAATRASKQLHYYISSKRSRYP